MDTSTTCNDKSKLLGMKSKRVLAMISYFKVHFFPTLADISTYLETPHMD